MKRNIVFKLSKGFVGRANNNYKLAVIRVEKGLNYAYRDRRNKKRDLRENWIEQINAATRQFGMPYNHFMHGLVKSNIALNRKMLAELAVNEPFSFMALTEEVKKIAPGRDTNKNLMTKDDYDKLKPEPIPEAFTGAVNFDELKKNLLTERFAKAQTRAEEINKDLIKSGKVILPKTEAKLFRSGKRKTPGLRKEKRKAKAASK
eukprot:TRINITY_DN10670_c0_g1_i1.p1 TRINITY_DN10670_c0_g1~~TRINITY_DN10670_c0_g1_i1.p1  ORF type:complete len:204 (+),score=60.76 TRINITY_DN10670_c0_g1_i1:30-641(+)